MTTFKQNFGVSRTTALVGAATVGLGIFVATSSADSSVAAPLCGVLKDLAPKVRGYQPVGVQAQLVMAISGRFDEDPTKLRQVMNEIDPLTTTACPKERNEMLKLLKMDSLQEAVR